MTIRELMGRDPVWISPTLSIADAARTMEERGCAFIPIIEGGRPIGVVTDRDLALTTAAHGNNPVLTQVAQVMSQPPFAVGADEDAEEAARKMVEHNVRRLVVLDGDRFAGIVSVVDLAGLVTDQSIAKALHALAEQNRPHDRSETQPASWGLYWG